MKMGQQILQGQLCTLEFEQVFQLSQGRLKEALVSELKALGYKPTSKKGFLYASGEVPVMLIAHMDTVHRQLAEHICYTEDGRIMMSPEGIGGDDRAGIYMILRILQEARCHVLFCEDEETGGQGARKFTRSSICPEVNYLIELDRHGGNDAVFYGCNNREFIKYICGFGFHESHGSFSDISVVAPHLDLAAVNISAGYYNEHRQHEYVRLDQIEENIPRVREIVLTATERFVYESYPPRSLSKDIWGEELTLWNMPGTRKEMRSLMELPSTVCLMMGSHDVGSSTSHYIDKKQRVYLYLSELSAAVMIDGAHAYSDSGEPLHFDTKAAQSVRVMEYDEAMELLDAG